jgi:hypothetical protein
MKKSSRHHYIPQFYIKGFVNDNGDTFVYDKQDDRIWKRQIKTKGIFYDWDRNTVRNDLEESSIIEDEWFKWLDNTCSLIIEKFRLSKNSEDLHNYDNVSGLQFFLINLLWRIPKFDYAFEFLFDKAEKLDSNGNPINFSNQNYLDGFKKVERAFLPNKIIKDITKQNLTSGFYSKLFDENQDVLLLGDYPMVYRNEPNSFDKIISKEVLLPISSKKLYAISASSGLDFSFKKITTLNSIIIDQSTRYVCSPDKDFLKKSVEFYKMQTEKLPRSFLIETLFENSKTQKND